MIKTAMILAAGRGERLRPLTDHTPKPLLPIRGKPMIHKLLEDLRAAGIERCVINVCYLAEQLIDDLGDGSRFGLQILWSPEATMLGAGGGVVQARSLIGSEPFVLLSGDVVSDYDVRRLVQHDMRAKAAHVVLVPNPPYHPLGDYALIDGRLALEGPTYTFAAMAVLSPSLLAQSTAFSLGDVLKPAIVSGLATGEVFLGTYHNVGTVDEYQGLG